MLTLATSREVPSFIQDKSMVMPVHQEDMSQIDRNTGATRVAGKDADPTKAALLASVTKRIDYTPKFGTELWGIQLSQLTEKQSEELAALIAERGVVFFRDQDDFDHQEHIKLGRRWGPLHLHPFVPQTKENPDITVIDSRFKLPKRYNTDERWHSDLSFEAYPGSFSILKFDTIPEAGGNAAWSNGYELYDSLSPPFQHMLEGLTARHSSELFRELNDKLTLQAFGKLDNAVHPVVRTHPVTGWKSIYVNPTFTREILGVSAEESKWILEFLERQVEANLKFQVHFRWEKESVAIWDNRCTLHASMPDYHPYHRRGVRVTVSGEQPFYDPTSGTQAEVWEARVREIVATQEEEEKKKREEVEKEKEKPKRGEYDHLLFEYFVCYPRA